MALANKAPRGGLVENLAGSPRTFLLRNAEIERFEDKHRGIFALWNGFFGKGKEPTTTEIRDLVALAMIGAAKDAGERLTEAQADEIVTTGGPGELWPLYQIAQAILGVAFFPESGEAETKPAKKKTSRKPGASAKS